MKSNNIKLGIFFTGGLVILIITLYILGSKQNLFESNIILHTNFRDAKGLQEGSSVRFIGISIGSVDQISIINDSMVHVSMKINKNHADFIKKDASAVISTDGLMGNKLITIMPGKALAQVVLDGDTIKAQKPIGMENVMNSVLENSRNLEELTKNLIDITAKISSGQGLVGKLLFDSTTSNDFQNIVSSTTAVAMNLQTTTSNVSDISKKIKNGEGTIGKLVYNDSIADGVNAIMDSLITASANINRATREMNNFTQKLNDGNGPLNRLVNDSIMAENLDKTIINVKERSEELEETIEIVNDSWILNLFSKNKKRQKENLEDY